MSEQPDVKIEEEPNVPYSLHKEMVEHLERNNKRWFIAFLIVLSMLFLTNLGWVIYESQFQDVVIDQDGTTDSGGSNYFNGTGELSIYGAEASDANQK